MNEAEPEAEAGTEIDILVFIRTNLVEEEFSIITQQLERITDRKF